MERAAHPVPKEAGTAAEPADAARSDTAGESGSVREKVAAAEGIARRSDGADIIQSDSRLV